MPCKKYTSLKRNIITPRRRLRRRNIEMGFYDDKGIFHPVRASVDYDPDRLFEPESWDRGYKTEVARKKAREKAEEWLKKRKEEMKRLREEKKKLKEEKKRAKTKKKAEKIKKNIPVLLANKPVIPVVEIYPKVERIFATKTKGANKGKYYHDFKRGVKAYGLSDGSVLLTHKKIKI